MKRLSLFISVLSLVIAFSIQSEAQNNVVNPSKQATPPPTQPFGKEAFGSTSNTVIRWLGGAGFFINSHGTTMMIDPVLKDFDMPLLIDMPISPEKVPHLDAVLVTHVDNDHFSIPTCQILSSVTKEFHSTNYVASIMKEQHFPSFGHDIGETFNVDSLNVKLTPAYHLWQNMIPNREREFKLEDYCGFWIETPDGTIWATGDSRLLDEHLQMPAPNAIFFDFSDSGWHFGLEGAVKLANTYPNASLLLCHWGTVDAPNMKEFNGNPEVLKGLVTNPERIYVLAPGEPFTLKKTVKVTPEPLIFPADNQAMPNFNTGEVYMSMLKGSGNNMIVNFLFTPGSRNYWHSHPGAEQALLVLDGEGFYQEEGMPKRIIRKGDVIVTPPDVYHWNGATPNNRLVCITVSERAERHVIQLRAVSDEEYAAEP